MDIIIQCPNCLEFIIININEINCGIFRHAVYKNNMISINPHETKINIEKMINNDEIYGCGKPFKIIKNKNKYLAINCEYI
jgi:hypothetical protein